MLEIKKKSRVGRVMSPMDKKTKNEKQKKKDESGFTLIELVLVATLIAILSTMAIASMSRARYKTLETGAATGLKAIASAEEMFYIDNGRYAFGFSALAVTYLPRAYSSGAWANEFVKNYSLRWMRGGGGGTLPPISNFSVHSYTVYAIPIDPNLKTFVITDAGAVQVVQGSLTDWSPY